MKNIFLKVVFILSSLLLTQGYSRVAYGEKIMWTTVEVQAGQVGQNQFPEGTENLKLVGTMNSNDFRSISRRLSSSLMRIDMSELSKIDNSENAEFPERALNNFERLQEVTFPLCVSSMYGAIFRGSNDIKKIVLKNSSVTGGSNPSTGMPSFWGRNTLTEGQIKAITLVVPKGSKDNYYSTSAPWKNFTIIEDNISDDNQELNKKFVTLTIEMYKVNEILVQDKTSNKTLCNQVSFSSELHVEDGHEIEISASGNKNLSIYDSYYEEEGKGKITISSFPISLKPEGKPIKVCIRYDALVNYGVRGGNGSIKAFSVDKIGDSEAELETGNPFGNSKQLKFIAIPEKGYKVKNWFINNVIQKNDSNILIIDSPNGTQNIEVEFEKELPKYSVQAVIAEGQDDFGAIKLYESPDGKVYNEMRTSSFIVNAGSFVKILATPNEGYIFKCFLVNDQEKSGDFSDKDCSYIIPNIDQNIKIVAQFIAEQKTQFKINARVNNPELGDIKIKNTTDKSNIQDVESGGTISEGTELTFIVNPINDKVIVSWKLNDEPIEYIGKTYKLVADQKKSINGIINIEAILRFPESTENFCSSTKIYSYEQSIFIYTSIDIPYIVYDIDGTVVHEAIAVAGHNKLDLQPGSYIIVLGNKSTKIVLK
ncbi:InlB B-repeat-containing protein [Falsiporphyromonas endometrii]|uniref:Bacterial repeat domain-containing protein n=1 Tax=Falsiporphyromonas endometrii TaxID=1387297 RepID=A0ABV9K5W3_9PORP